MSLFVWFIWEFGGQPPKRPKIITILLISGIWRAMNNPLRSPEDYFPVWQRATIAIFLMCPHRVGREQYLVPLALWYQLCLTRVLYLWSHLCLIISLLKTVCQTVMSKLGFIVQLINTNSSVTLPHGGILLFISIICQMIDSTFGINSFFSGQQAAFYLIR